MFNVYVDGKDAIGLLFVACVACLLSAVVGLRSVDDSEKC
jgi:hypothetical protein